MAAAMSTTILRTRLAAMLLQIKGAHVDAHKHHASEATTQALRRAGVAFSTLADAAFLHHKPQIIRRDLIYIRLTLQHLFFQIKVKSQVQSRER